MLIYPAIDLRGGRVVRLSQGDYDRMTVYSDDPVCVARGFVEAGASCLHAVDLDGAKAGGPMNREVIKRLCGLPLFTEAGGGMRTEADVENTLALGVDRVILGTVAVTDFGLVKRLAKRYGDRLAVGVDARDGLVATHGWRETSALKGVDFCRKVLEAGINTVIYTDISRDGQLRGTNLDVYGELSKLSGLRVIASGGVSFESEIAALREMGVYGAILGKALYAGKLDFDWDIAALPVDARQYNTLHTGFYTISSTCKNPDAAWKVIEWLMGEQGQNINSKASGNPSALMAIAGQGAWKVEAATNVTNWDAITKSLGTGVFGYTCLPAGVTGNAVSLFNSALLGQVTPREAVDQATQYAAETIGY